MFPALPSLYDHPMAKAQRRPVKAPPKIAGQHDAHAELVRFSREGDQFHYLWAARRLLKLVDPTSNLVGVSIEGVSPDETEATPGIQAGESVIDVAEYEGAEKLADAKGISYLQLKHSTKHPGVPWDADGLHKTIAGFAERFSRIDSSLGHEVSSKVRCELVTNRPIATSVIETVADLAADTARRHPRTARALVSYANLPADVATRFWQTVRLRGSEGGRGVQQSRLVTEVAQLMAGRDASAALQLKELVVRMVLPGRQGDSVIHRGDVLQAVGVAPEQLFPASNRIDVPADAVPRALESEIARKIVGSSNPVIVEASSGVGKSVLAMRLGGLMPPGSVTIVYDCFGSGEYRQRAHPRHRAKDGLVQIANELATRGLCDILIPSPAADDAAYFRAFEERLVQAAGVLRRANPDAVLLLVIDAADNAEMGAEEAGDKHAFVRDLLRHRLPDGVRLVMLCRPERTSMLNPPPGTDRQTLHQFSWDETSVHLRKHFSKATDAEVEEFHHRTSQNPRVQANALALRGDISTILRSLGPNPKSVNDTISDQLSAAIAEIRDNMAIQNAPAIGRLCSALAMLRPLIPLDVIAAVSGLSVDAIRSFAIDFAGGRPIMIRGDSLQFRDEPVEDWFRNNYRAGTVELGKFVDQLKPIAESSPYVAAALPSMLLEAGRLDELIAMTLRSEFLPRGNALQRRDIAVQRLQFSLRASLKAGRHLDATKLALRLGGESAGDSRHLALIQENTDLSGALLDAGTIQELVTRRGFKGKWAGARYTYEAALLAQIPSLAAEARSRLRLAKDCARALRNLSAEEKRTQSVSSDDVAEFALIQLKLDGADACVQELLSWRPKSLSYGFTCTVVSRLLDADDLPALAALDASLAASRELLPGMAMVDELAGLGRLPSAQLTRALLRRLPKRKLLGERRYSGSKKEGFGLISVVHLITAALSRGIGRREVLLSRLEAQLPKDPPAGWADPWSGVRHSYLRAYALRDTLRGKESTLEDLAEPELRKKLSGTTSHSTDARRFRSHVAPVWSFARLLATWQIDCPVDQPTIRNQIAEALNQSGSADDARDHDRIDIERDTATLWLQLLVLSSGDETAQADFVAWLDQPERRIYQGTWAGLARIAARASGFHRLAIDFCQRARRNEDDSGEQVSSRIQLLISVARALLPLDRAESSACLERSIEVASKIGDDAYDRWDCTLQLAECATRSILNYPELAYRLSRCAELVSKYLEDHFDWDTTMRMMCRISPEGGLEALSRWRDRNVGWFDRLLPAALEPLAEHGVIDSREAAAFIGFNFAWNYSQLLDQALSMRDTSTEEQARLLDGFEASLKLQNTQSSMWHRLAQTASRHGLDASKFVHMAEKTAASASVRASHDQTELLPLTPEQLDETIEAVLSGKQFLVNEALRRFDYLQRRQTGPTGFWAQLLLRVPAGREVSFIESALQDGGVSVLDANFFLQAIPPFWRGRLAIQAALKRSLESLLAQNHTYIWHARKYQRVSIPEVAAAAGEPISWALAALFKKFASSDDPLESGQAFQLVSLLSMALPADEALEALNFSLDLIEENLQPADGDGSWNERLRPTSGAPAATAELLWGCLGAPQASIRWQAAHSVRRLCALSKSAVLDRLLGLASGAKRGAFLDARFVFYDMHAKTWLLVALARAAKESPAVVARFVDFIEGEAQGAEPHVLNRHFAAQALLTVHATQKTGIDKDAIAKLRAVNASPFPPNFSETSLRRSAARAGVVDGAPEYNFPYNMDRDWFDPLARAFGLSGAEVEQMTASVIRDDWQVTSPGGWREDMRRSAKVLPDDYSSSTSSSRVDGLDYYRSIHAVMVTAGKLLASRAAYIDSDGSSMFEEWLNSHLLSLDDGRWLSDCRDPVPDGVRPNWSEFQRETWQWAVTPEELLRCFDDQSGELTVYGNWVSHNDYGQRQVRVASSLVSPVNATALLRALQSIDNPHDFVLPRADTDSELDEGDFQLKGWIDDFDVTKRLDKFDPWAGDIPYPPPSPARFVQGLLGISLDENGRAWRAQGDSLLHSETWGTGQNRDGYADEEGTRLRIQTSALKKLLSEVRMDLIVDVQIEHRRTGLRTSAEGQQDWALLQPYFRIFHMNSDGTYHTLR